MRIATQEDVDSQVGFGHRMRTAGGLTAEGVVIGASKRNCPVTTSGLLGDARRTRYTDRFSSTGTSARGKIVRDVASIAVPTDSVRQECFADLGVADASSYGSADHPGEILPSNASSCIPLGSAPDDRQPPLRIRHRPM